MALYRYSRWDGTQSLEPFTASDLMDHLADKILDENDLWSAMREMIQRGAQFPSGRRMMGLRDLVERLREQRQRQLQRYNLNSVMDDIKERLDKIVDQERQGIQKRLDEGKEQAPSEELRQMLENMAKKHLEQLEQLPENPGGQIQQLREYDFMDQDARQQFQDLLEEMRQQVMDSYFQQLKQSLGAMTPETMNQMGQMVRDLNKLLEQHRHGDDSGFQDFMDKWGQFFPQGMENVEQLAQYLQQSMSRMQSLLDSMSPEMRNELEQMVQSLFQDPGLQRELAQLMNQLGRMFPDQQGEPFPFSGDDPVTLQEAMRLMNDMQGLDELEQELMQAVRTNKVDDLNADQIGRLVGDEAKQIAEQLRDLAKMLEEAGLIQKKGKDWELTPRAIRRVGERALEDIFGRIDPGLSGDHSLSRFGWGIERLDDTKTYTFGDAFALDANASLMNALRREGRGTPVHMIKDDFEVYRQSSVNQCSTVIALDMSYSMLRAGRFNAGRKVALALDSLIRSKFPRDTLHVVAFSYFVLTLEPHMLLDSYWVDPRGTNIQEALRQARFLLRRQKSGTKQIILITDGEPRTHSYWYDDRDDAGAGANGYRGAWAETLREVVRCTRDNITINIFMMDHDPVLMAFVKTMTKINKGRALFADPNELGEYLIVDYVKNRRKAA
ncbi:MAG: VWA domain-containing protein [Chloroflexi bacterium]|nr:VWA domain-containing protein [Chloroflexota bacterium]